mgnify:CR=1 FL=1
MPSPRSTAVTTWTESPVNAVTRHRADEMPNAANVAANASFASIFANENDHAYMMAEEANPTTAPAR